MGFGNARHGGNSTEEHEREDDDSLHLDLTPFHLSPLTRATPHSVELAASNFGLRQERTRRVQPDATESEPGARTRGSR